MKTLLKCRDRLVRHTELRTAWGVLLKESSWTLLGCSSPVIGRKCLELGSNLGFGTVHSWKGLKLTLLQNCIPCFFSARGGGGGGTISWSSCRITAVTLYAPHSPGLKSLFDVYIRVTGNIINFWCSYQSPIGYYVNVWDDCTCSPKWRMEGAATVFGKFAGEREENGVHLYTKYVHTYTWLTIFYFFSRFHSSTWKRARFCCSFLVVLYWGTAWRFVCDKKKNGVVLNSYLGVTWYTV